MTTPLQALAPAAAAERWLAAADRRHRAIRAIVCAGSVTAIGDAGASFGAPFLLIEVPVKTPDHHCGPDCPCWPAGGENSEEICEEV